MHTHTCARAHTHTHTHTHARTHTLSLSLSLSLVGCWRLYRQSALNPDSDFRSKHILLSSALRETRGIVLEKRKQLHLNGQKLQENLVNDFSFANWKGRNFGSTRGMLSYILIDPRLGRGSFFLALDSQKRRPQCLHVRHTIVAPPRSVLYCLCPKNIKNRQFCSDVRSDVF